MLLSAHRCLTRFNEGDGAWPEWVPAWAHTCLLGCLACQEACPANPPLVIEETGVRFSAAETRALLEPAGASTGRTESAIRIKLAWLGQSYSGAAIGRNLRALVNASPLTAAAR